MPWTFILRLLIVIKRFIEAILDDDSANGNHAKKSY